MAETGKPLAESARMFMFDMVSLAKSLDPLRAFFYDGRDRLRFLAVLSPT